MCLHSRFFVLNKYWVAFFLLKIFYMFFALFIYSKFTVLGDTSTYLSCSAFPKSDFFWNSTSFMINVSCYFSRFLGSVFANLPFLLISFYGIYYAVRRLNLNNRELFFVLLLLSFPSFGVWTSIASKEAIGVFFMGIIAGFIIDYVNGNPNKNFFLVGFAFYICAIFKPQYLIGISALILFVFLCRKFSLQGIGKAVVLILFFVFSFLALYFARNEINELSFIMPAHFTLEAGSTRENTIWVNDFDVFWNAPYGMFIGFFGPTIGEALSKSTHLIAFLESSMIVGFFLFAVFKLMLITINTGRLNIFYLGFFLTTTLWVLFVHYPFGVLNPGSAIRYRQNFYGFLVVLFYFSYIEVHRSYRLARTIMLSDKGVFK